MPARLNIVRCCTTCGRISEFHERILEPFDSSRYVGDVPAPFAPIFRELVTKATERLPIV